MMKPSYAALLEALKRSDGLPVSDLARELKMSYMGVKQHCLNLAKKGYLEEWRLPRGEKEVGRPEKLYRLSAKCDGLFPQGGGDITLSILEGLRMIYGETAPEKMMFHFFQDLETRWQMKIGKCVSLAQKIKILMKLRDQTGWFSRVLTDENGYRIEEYHNPLRKIYEKYPSVERMEALLIERLLSVDVQRREVSIPKRATRVVYEIAADLSAENSQEKPSGPDIQVERFEKVESNEVQSVEAAVPIAKIEVFESGNVEVPESEDLAVEEKQPEVEVPEIASIKLPKKPKIVKTDSEAQQSFLF